MTSNRSIRCSPSLVLAIRANGIVVPKYEGRDEIVLDAVGLRSISRLSSTGLGLDDQAMSDQPGTALVAELRERGLLVGSADVATESPARAPLDGPAPSGVDGEQQWVFPTPVLVRCGPEGFEVVDHDGVVVARLGVIELFAASAFRFPATVDAAAERHHEELGADALDRESLAGLAARLLRTGALVPFDHDDPAHARNARQVEQLRDGMRRQAQIHQAFDRIEAEHDARGGPADRVPVIGFHTSFSGLPASLGVLMAAAHGYEGGRLEQSYDFRPRLLWDRTRLEAVASTPGIYLFSNYIWSTPTNLAHSALVKELNPHALTIHGGPDTPKYEGDTERYFADNPHIDVAVHGEGEATFPHLLDALRGHVGDGPPDLSALADVPGLSYRDGDRVVRTAPRDRIADLNEIPSAVLLGIYDGFLPAGGGPGGLNLETNRGCPYGCTFCDWGSATLSRIRKFDLDRVFAELEWCAKNGFKVVLCDANFGIFERDVEIAEKIAELKSAYGYPKFVGTNYAKNTVKHLSRIIEIFTDVGIVAEGKMSMQTFDTDTLLTIRRKNIKVEKYDDLGVEFRRNHLPLSVDIMMGLPGATPEAFRNDLQSCIDRDIRSIVHTTVLLANSPMNEPEYRVENGIVARPGEEVRESSTFTRAEWDEMYRLRTAFWLFENFGILRQVATYVRAETSRREIEFYEQLVLDVHDHPDEWPALAVTLRVLPDLMVPPVSWRWMVDELRRYLVEQVGLADDGALDTVLAVQHALLPARDREFPLALHLDHDYASWHAAVAALRDDGHLADWHERIGPLRSHGPASFTVDDPLDSCQRFLGPTYTFLSEDSAWDLASPVSRPRQADLTTRKAVA
jgi:radical SAM superfamily enzyme YgiQ (UPF0313 family)